MAVLSTLRMLGCLEVRSRSKPERVKHPRTPVQSKFEIRALLHVSSSQWSFPSALDLVQLRTTRDCRLSQVTNQRKWSPTVTRRRIRARKYEESLVIGHKGSNRVPSRLSHSGNMSQEAGSSSTRESWWMVIVMGWITNHVTDLVAIS